MNAGDHVSVQIVVDNEVIAQERLPTSNGMWSEDKIASAVANRRGLLSFALIRNGDPGSIIGSMHGAIKNGRKTYTVDKGDECRFIIKKGEPVFVFREGS